VAARHRSANKAARRAQRSGEADDFHLTRIRFTRLRYALEFVSDMYDKRTGKYLRHVVKLQDALGLMQDARVAATRLQQLATAEGSTLSPTTVFVMGGVTERYRHESDRLARKVPGLLHELRGPEWRKLTALMDRRRLELGAQYRWPGPTSTAMGQRTSPAPAPPATPTPATPTLAPPAPAPPASASPGDLVPGRPPTPIPDTPTMSPPAPNVPSADPAATHPAAGRPDPARLVPTSWSADPVSGAADGPGQVPGHPAPHPSTNGEGPNPEGR
jgi:hypothetical protein